MIGVHAGPGFGMNEDEMFTISTSHVERNNLTMRTFMKRFDRLRLLFKEACQPCGGHGSVFRQLQFLLATSLSGLERGSRSSSATPAMMAGVTERLWKFDDLFTEVKGRCLPLADFNIIRKTTGKLSTLVLHGYSARMPNPRWRTYKPSGSLSRAWQLSFD